VIADMLPTDIHGSTQTIPRYSVRFRGRGYSPN